MPAPTTPFASFRAPTLEPFRWPERAALFAVAVALVVAMAVRTQLLQIPGAGLSPGAAPVTSNDLKEGFGDVFVEPTALGCVQLRTRAGQVKGPFCNSHLFCGGSALTYDVVRLPTPETFYVETGSRCDATCCDWRGMSFTGDGRRLDDGLWERLGLRLQALGTLSLALVIAAAAWIATWRRPTRAERILLLAASAVTVAMVIWNL